MSYTFQVCWGDSLKVIYPKYTNLTLYMQRNFPIEGVEWTPYLPLRSAPDPNSGWGWQVPYEYIYIEIDNLDRLYNFKEPEHMDMQRTNGSFSLIQLVHLASTWMPQLRNVLLATTGRPNWCQLFEYFLFDCSKSFDHIVHKICIKCTYTTHDKYCTWK